MPAAKEKTASAEEKKEKAKAEPKPKLTQEERVARVRDARESRVRAFFDADTYDYVGPATVEGGYTDITGNRGIKGHTVKARSTGDETVIGPTALKKGVETYAKIEGYQSPAQKRAEAREAAAAEKAAQAEAVPAEA